MNKKTILVDMDDVIVTASFVKSMEKFLGKKLIFEECGFHMQEMLGNRKQEYFDTAFENVNIYDKDCKIMDDCQRVLKNLNKYYEIYICTAYIWPERKDLGGKICKEKYDYLFEYFSFLNPYNFMMVNNKKMCNADIRIDDKLSNFVIDSKNLLFTAYHNKQVDKKELIENNAIRVDSWNDIEKLLLSDLDIQNKYLFNNKKTSN